MKRFLTWLWRREEGSAAVEFALVAPLMLVVMTGIVEAGHAYFVYNNLAYAADEAARYAMLHPTSSEEALEEEAATKIVSFDPDDLAVSIDDTVIEGKNYRHITLSYAFPTLIGSVFGEEDIALSSDTTVPLLP